MIKFIADISADIPKEIAEQNKDIEAFKKLIEVYEKIRCQDVQDFLAKVAIPQRVSLACIYPTTQEETQ